MIAAGVVGFGRADGIEPDNTYGVLPLTRPSAGTCTRPDRMACDTVRVMDSEIILHLSGPVLVGPDDEVAEAWVVDGCLTLEPPAARPSRQHDVQRIDGWVLPGMVDAHNHIGLGVAGGVDEATAEAQARADLTAGTLLIRDAGSPVDTRWIDGRDDLPRVIRAGRHIARTRRYLPGVGHEIEPEQLADEVRTQAARGDGWVKLVGDWIDREIGDLAPCWPAWAVREAIDAAHAAGVRVTAHCFGEDCLPDLIEAGIDCIEHATGLTDDTIRAAAARGTAIVPTLVNTDNFPEFATAGDARYPVYSAHLRRLYAQRHQSLLDAYEAGLPVFVGTDAGGRLPHGLVAAEVSALVEAGIPTVSALDGACWGARSWLGRPGLTEGASADLVVYPEDPRRDVRVLSHPTLAVLRGRVVG